MTQLKLTSREKGLSQRNQESISQEKLGKGGDIFYSLCLSVGWLGEEKHTHPKSTKGALGGSLGESDIVPKNL